MARGRHVSTARYCRPLLDRRGGPAVCGGALLDHGIRREPHRCCSPGSRRAYRGARVSDMAAPARRLTRFLHVIPIVAFRGLAGGMPILIGLYIAHRWGLASLGAYTFAASYVAVGLMITDWGCTRWLPCELALVRLTPGAPPTAAATANALRLTITVAFLVVTWVLAVAHILPADSTRFALELGLLCPITIYSMNGVSDRIVTREIGGIATAVFIGLALFALLAFGGQSFVPGPD